MNAKERENFWNTLCTLQDYSEESLQKLKSTSNPPKTLCRFRSVSENSLVQLQENTQFFSTADYYDDPFDTYFTINFHAIENLYQSLRDMIANGDNNIFKSVFNALNLPINIDDFIQKLKNETLDIPKLNSNLRDIRSLVQRQICSICFSENPFNETMWMKYANNHKGFVLTYDFSDSNTFLCGKEEKCKECGILKTPPYLFPVFYSDKKYDATVYALGLCLLNGVEGNVDKLPEVLQKLLGMTVIWQRERISLIKKECHHYDEEWRLLSPVNYRNRPQIKLKPNSVIIGLRTPAYEQELIISAAKIAGIKLGYRIFINDANELDKMLLWEE